MRTAARAIGKRIKRHRALSRPARVSVDEYSTVVREIESLRDPYRAAARMMLCFGMRATETLSLSPSSILSGGKLFVPDRETKTHSDLLLPLPVKYIPLIEGWLSVIGESEIKYNTLVTTISRAGIKWRCHDLRKLFRRRAWRGLSCNRIDIKSRSEGRSERLLTISTVCGNEVSFKQFD